MAGAARSHIRRSRGYIFTARDRISKRNVLVTLAQCAGKYIAYTRSLAAPARRQPDVRPLQPFAAAKIYEKIQIDR